MVRGRYTRWAQPFSFHRRGRRGAGAGSPAFSRAVALPIREPRAASGEPRTATQEALEEAHRRLRGRGGRGTGGCARLGRRGAGPGQAAGEGRVLATTLRQSSAVISPPPTSHSRGRLRTDPTERISISHLRRARQSRTPGQSQLTGLRRSAFSPQRRQLRRPSFLARSAAARPFCVERRAAVLFAADAGAPAAPAAVPAAPIGASVPSAPDTSGAGASRSSPAPLVSPFICIAAKSWLDCSGASTELSRCCRRN